MTEKKCCRVCVQYESNGWDENKEAVLPVRAETYQMRIRCSRSIMENGGLTPKRIAEVVPGVSEKFCRVEAIDDRYPGVSEIRMQVPSDRDPLSCLQEFFYQNLITAVVDYAFFTPVMTIHGEAHEIKDSDGVVQGKFKEENLQPAAFTEKRPAVAH